MAQDRQEWRRMCERGSPVSDTTQEGRIYCDRCKRSFSRSQDKTRHRCDSVRSRHAVSNMSAPVVCHQCQRTFQRPQDMARGISVL